MPANVVIVDEDQTFVSQLREILTEAGHNVCGVTAREDALRIFERIRERVDLAIIEFLVYGTTGPELIASVKRHLEKTKVIATVPGEGPDLTHLAALVEADLVIRRCKKGEPPNRERWLRAVDELLSGHC